MQGETDATRGFGLLENFLSGKRAQQADKHIPGTSRSGKILDIGCGNYPLFLMKTDFSEKFALDKHHFSKPAVSPIRYSRHNIEDDPVLPFPDDFFEVVTMLAVIEHFNPKILPGILAQVNRVVKQGGLLFLTTPAAWTDSLLRAMARLKLVSSDEVDEHKDVYTINKISNLLWQAGFRKEKIVGGYFELGMNIWMKACK